MHWCGSNSNNNVSGGRHSITMHTRSISHPHDYAQFAKTVHPFAQSVQMTYDVTQHALNACNTVQPCTYIQQSTIDVPLLHKVGYSEQPTGNSPSTYVLSQYINGDKLIWNDSGGEDRPKAIPRVGQKTTV